MLPDHVIRKIIHFGLKDSVEQYSQLFRLMVLPKDTFLTLHFIRLLVKSILGLNRTDRPLLEKDRMIRIFVEFFEDIV